MKKIIFSIILIALNIYYVNAQGGGVDYTFVPPNATDGAVNAIVVQPDGSILLAGNFQKYGAATVNRIVRIFDDATRDVSFNPGAGAGSAIQCIALQPDGKILIGGIFSTYDGVVRNHIARLNANGSLDASFDPGNVIGPLVQTVAVQPDGKILIGGLFTEIQGTTVNNIARLNADGSLDASFNMGTGANDYIANIKLQSDGKILIAGYLTEYNDISRGSIARLNTDGTLDLSFDPGTGANELVGAVTVLDNNKILIAGEFTEYNGTAFSRIARLEADGTLDAGFNPGTGANAFITSLAIQADDKIIVAGQFTNFNGVSKNRLTRLMPNGSQDLTFNTGTGANNVITSCVLQADSMILIGGVFTAYSNQNRKSVARVHDGCGLVFRAQNASICQGESYIFNNHTYTAAGTYLDTLQTALGCDSIVITILAVNASGTFNNPQIICAGNSYTIGTNTYTVTGTYRDTLQNVAGCDSIVVTQLTRIPATLSSSATICQGNSYDFMDSTYTVAGTYIHELELSGCLVPVSFHLTVTPAPFSNINKTICHGESYTYNGHTYTVAGVYRDTLDKGLGCDSIVITTLTVDQPDVSVTQNGAGLSANAVNVSYQWLDAENGYAIISNATDQVYTPLVQGNYAVEITSGSCVDTSEVYEIIFAGVRSSAFQKSIQFAPNPVEDYLELTADPAIQIQSVKILNISAQVVAITDRIIVDVSELSNGVYILEVETNQGIWRERFVK